MTSNKVRIVVLASGHAATDTYVNLLTPLWPVVARTFTLTQTQVGWIVQLLGLVANFGQPILGYLTDRHRLRRLIVLAILVTTFFMSTVGYLHSLWTLMLWLALGYVGVALFHPRAGSVAATVSGRRKMLGLSVFGAGGALGCALGNIMGPVLYNIHGSITGLIYALPLGLVVSAAFLAVNPEAADDARDIPTFSFRRNFVPHVPRLLPIFLVMLLRVVVIIAFTTFIPFLIDARHLPITLAGKAGLFFLIGGAAGGLIGARLCEWCGPRIITILSQVCAIPLLLASLHVDGIAFLLLLFLGGTVLRLAEAINIAQTQRLIPGGESLAASIGMGLVWGVGGFITPLAGKLADMHGQVYALTWMLALPVLAAIIGFWTPREAALAETAPAAPASQVTGIHDSRFGS